MTITQMLASMTSTELAYWEIKRGEEYLGDERADFNAALIRASIANFAGKTLKDEVTVDADDLMPFTNKPQAVPTPELLDAKLHHMMQMNTRVKQAPKGEQP